MIKQWKSSLSNKRYFILRFSVTFVSLCFVWVGFSANAVELQAGTSKRVITNDVPRFTVNGPKSEGVVKDIHARCLTLFDGTQRLVFITYDLNCLDVGTAPLRKRLQAELGIPKENLILLATHNHNAPIQINPENFDFGQWLADTMFEMIEEAIANEEGPAQVLFGSGYGYFIFSRGNAPTDYELQMLKVMVDDEPKAILFNHGTHPAQASQAKIGPGHPGWAMDAVEAKYPGALAMYFDASGGNQFVRRPENYTKELADARREGDDAVDAVLQKYAEEIGAKLADVAIDIAENADFVDVTGPLSSSYEIFSLPLGEPISREEAEKLLEKVPDDVGFVAYPHDHRNTNWVRMLLRYYDKGLPFPKETTDMICTDDTYLIHKEDKEFLEKYDYSIDDELPCIYEETIVAQIGPMPFVAMQGEVCAPIGARVKDAFRADMPIFVTAYMGEHNLYIPTRELVRQNAYQAQVIQIQYASPVGWDPSVEDVMVEKVIDMVEKKVGESKEERTAPKRLKETD